MNADRRPEGRLTDNHDQAAATATTRKGTSDKRRAYDQGRRGRWWIHQYGDVCWPAEPDRACTCRVCFDNADETDIAIARLLHGRRRTLKAVA